MASQEQMTQEQVAALLYGTGKKPGDGSRYGKRHELGVMNKTEAEYGLILYVRLLDGLIADYEFECEPLKLGHRCTYRPDFRVRHLDGTLEYIEVKSIATVNATTTTKLKWAKQRYPECVFSMEVKLKTGWKRTVFKGES